MHSHFQSDDAYIRDSFLLAWEKLKELKLPTVCCVAHRNETVPKLIFEFVVIRYRFQARWFTNQNNSTKLAQHAHRKLSKLVGGIKGKQATKKKAKLLKAIKTFIP